MRVFRIFILVLLSFDLFAQQVPRITFGGPDNDGGTSVMVTNDGGYLITGTTRSYGSGSLNIFILKLNASGEQEWIKIYGWKHQSFLCSAMEIDNGYAFVGYVWDFGMAREDVYFLKTDLNGQKEKHFFYGTHSKEMGFNFVRAKNGDFILLGYSRGYEPRGDIFVVRIDKDGNEIWRNHYGSQFDDYAFQLTGDDINGYYIVGSRGGFYKDVHGNYQNHDADIYLIKIDRAGNELWGKTYGKTGHDFGYSIIRDKNGGNGFYLLGSSQSYGNGSFDMLLLKVDTLGNELWYRTFGGKDYEYGCSVVQNSICDLYLLGTTKSFGLDHSPDFYLVKTDEQGNEIWSLTIGGQKEDYGYKVAATADSGCIVVGKSNSFGEGKFDMLLVKVDKNGIIQDFMESLKPVFKQDVMLAPNPMTNYGTLIFNNSVIPDTYHLEIYSLAGMKVADISILPTKSRFTLSLPSGVYIYHLIRQNDPASTIRGKLVIQ